MPLEHNSISWPYSFNPSYSKAVAYFSMEFAIDPCLKIYSGGLGFLAGSHMRSVYELRQQLVGVGILWKYGYYDQDRDEQNRMEVRYREKDYSFLEDTGIRVKVSIAGSAVVVGAFLLPPKTFETAPIFLLSTDIPENDHLSRTITQKLYFNNTETRLAQNMVLGIGGAKVLEVAGYQPQIYHMNEAHSLPLAFHLYEKLGNLDAVKGRLVFTTHTPEAAGNEISTMDNIVKMGYLSACTQNQIHTVIYPEETEFNHTLVALRMSKACNAVSKLHAEVSRRMWEGYSNIPKIQAITNAQNKTYWADHILEDAQSKKNMSRIASRKKELKEELFKEVALQSGKIFDPNVLTLVWARRFAEYKRANLLTRDLELFKAMLSHSKHPVQVIWAGKPYPLDLGAVKVFNELIEITKSLPNATVLTGYELKLSKLLKQGADLWLNTPRITREASGTSGMTAAMNGAINVSIADGWIPEFAEDDHNCFLIPHLGHENPVEQQDQFEAEQLYKLLLEEIVPMYYQLPHEFEKVRYNSMHEIAPEFDSGRMAKDYYKLLY